MRYPVYPAFTPRITQRLPSREGPRAGVETSERSDEQNMWRFLEARWRDWRLILHLKFSAAHYPPIAQRLPQGRSSYARIPTNGVSRAALSPAQPPARHALSDCVCAQQDAVLQEIAASGESKYEWAALKPLLASKVEQACREYYETSQDIDESKNGDTFDAVLKRTLSLLDAFPNAPFTLQRLCELLLDPRKPYRTSTRKLMSAIEKLLSVSSTVPVMSALPAKPGSYQAAAEYELAKLITGEAGAAEAMEVESHP